MVNGFIGRFAVNFFTDGSYSDAYLFKSTLEAERLDIIGQVNSKFDDTFGTPVGEGLSTVTKELFLCRPLNFN